MAIYSGKLLKFDGSAGNFVNIFNWEDGVTVAVVEVNENGEWNYEPTFNKIVGITYIGNGCVPITHGKYILDGKYGDGVSLGYLLIAYASSGSGRYIETYDKLAINNISWSDNFEQVIEIGLLNYVYGSGAREVLYESKIIDGFNLDWYLQITGANGTIGGDRHLWTLEFLDGSGKVVAAIKSETDGTYRSGLWYGASLTSMRKAGQTGSYPATNGHLTFNSASIEFIDNPATKQRNLGFQYAVDMTKVVSIRVAGSALSNYTSGGGAGGFIKIVNRPV